MIWSFTRGPAQLDIEVRRVPHGGRYELIVDYPNGSERVERFLNPRKLVDRTLKLQRKLILDGWTPTGPAGTHLRTKSPPPGGRRRIRRIRDIAHLLAEVHHDVSRRLTAAFGL
jgi:hypothetical protein